MRRWIKEVFIVCWMLVISVLIFCPIIVDISASEFDESKASVKYRKKVKILDMVSVDEDKSCIYLVINERYKLPKDFPSGHVLKCDDPKIIADVVNSPFVVTGYDMTTVENEIFIYENNILRFRSEIVLDEDQVGLQSMGYGYIYCSNYNVFLESVNKFKRVYGPLIFL